MGIGKRAFLYLTRKKGKTALLLGLLFLMTTLALIALGIQRGASDAAEDLRLSFGSTFTLKVRYDGENPDLWKIEDVIVDGKVQGSTKIYTGPVIDDALIDKVLAIDGVERYVIDSITHFLYTEGLDIVPGAYASTVEEDPNDIYWAHALDFQVTGDSELHSAFRTGALEIVAGRHIQPGGQGEVLISDVMAQRSGLTVGDTFTASGREGLEVPDGDYETVTAGPFTMHIVGIFKINAALPPSSYLTIESWYPENYVFMDTSHEDVLGSGGKYSSATFFVEDPKELDRVIGEAEDIEGLDPMYFTIRRDDALYRSSAGPLQTMSSLSLILIIVVLLGCAFLIYLILSMGVKSRGHEIGVLLSMGVSKWKILWQQLLECLLVFAVAFLLSWGSASLLASPVGNAVLSAASPPQGEVKAPEYVMLEGFVYDAPARTPVSIDIPLGPGEIASVAAAGCAVIALSITLAGVPILKKKPKDVLSSMS
ncbi:ABC transporter permease [Zongyangia hominis]|uniref:ABC transporter permease n=1 Tax=Zongyangia hominis TaxID=2763677 RepID=A0A926IBH1_9FIRM|nr:ABC transporter permease [Zongyangia hominis]MBC8571231.1 ABC transporter permease [Zongyangia hominis]